MSDKKVRKDIIDSFARFLIPEIRKYYESEQGQREFEAWEAQQEQEQEDTNK